jgi:branched-subunit amino acid transport protein
VTFHLVTLAVLMWAVTYPWRAVPLLTLGVKRLPPSALAYFRLVGPAVLAALAVVNVVIVSSDNRPHHLHVGIDAAAVVVCILIVTCRRHILPGLATAVAIVAIANAIGHS